MASLALHLRSVFKLSFQPVPPVFPLISCYFTFSSTSFIFRLCLLPLCFPCVVFYLLSPAGKFSTVKKIWSGQSKGKMGTMEFLGVINKSYLPINQQQIWVDSFNFSQTSVVLYLTHRFTTPVWTRLNVDAKLGESSVCLFRVPPPPKISRWYSPALWSLWNWAERGARAFPAWAQAIR